MSPLVTVIMPAYERPEMITVAIGSALRQTMTDFVLAIGDNSTSDAVELAVAKFDDPRIVYKRNRPASDAQTNWVDLAKSAGTPYLASLHDDDVWEPDFLEKMMIILERNPEVALAFCDYWIIDSDGEKLPEFTDKVTAWHHRDQLIEGTFDYDLEQGIRLATVWNAPQPAYAAVMRTEAVQATEFREDLAPLYDIWLSYQFALKGRGIHYIPERLTQYRVHSQSLSSRSFAVAEDAFFNHVIDSHAELGVSTEIKEHWADIRWGRATKAMLEESGKELSKEEFAQAFSGLHGKKKIAAWLGAHSEMVWNGIRWMKRKAA